MENIFGKSFRILKENLVFMQPLLIHFLLLFTVLPYILAKTVTLYTKSFMLLCVFLLTAAISAGVFHVSKNAVDEYKADEDEDEDEKREKSIKNFKTFFEGTGANFFRVLFALILFLAIYIAAVKGLNSLCVRYWGIPAIVSRAEELMKLETVNQVMAFVNSFSETEIFTMHMWILVLTAGTSLLNFLGFLYMAALFYEKDSFIICFAKTIFYFFKRFFKSLYIILFMFIIYIAVNIISALFSANVFLLAISILLTVLYFNFYIILVLCFYNERTKTDSNSGAECNGENTACN